MRHEGARDERFFKPFRLFFDPVMGRPGSHRDATVVEADVVYPTDSGLLAKGEAKLARLSAQLNRWIAGRGECARWSRTES